MVQPLTKDTSKSIATKSIKKPQNNAFADFMKNLGKTTIDKKGSEIADIKADVKKVDFKADSTKIDSANAKAEILSTILKGKNEEVKSPKIPPNPLDMLLGRPKATQTKLNKTPEITQNIQNTSERFTNKDALINTKETQTLPQTSKIPQQKTQNDDKYLNQTQIAESPLDNIPQSQKQQINANITPQNTTKETQTLPQTSKIPQQKTQNDDKSLAQEKNLNEIPPNIPNLAKSPQKSEVKSSQNITQIQADKTSKIPQIAESNNIDSITSDNLTQEINLANITKDDILKNNTTQAPLSQTQTSESPKEAPQTFSNIGIKNTLKYGAFAAFDALSLLKPSDGKKLSELIKKADELSLNLQSIKYTKIGDSKPTFSNMPTQNASLNHKQDSTNLAQDLTQNITKFESDSTKSDITTQAKDSTAKETNIEHKDTKNTQKIDENNAKNTQPQSPKQDSAKIDLKEPKEAPQNTKQAESKIDNTAESPLKNILNNNKNSDIKPANFTTENKQEQHTKPTQDNQPIASAESSTKIEHKIFDAKETMRHFANNLKQEIQNYKPPLSKITIELQPANLGNVEVSIISQGKNIQIQLHSNQQTLNLFIQNQSDLRAALTQIGYENVAMSFNNGSQMGFSDNNGKWRYESNNKFRNAFSLNNESEDNEDIFEIMIINNYA